MNVSCDEKNPRNPNPFVRSTAMSAAFSSACRAFVPLATCDATALPPRVMSTRT